MTTVIAVYNSDGCVGRCDANCHNATSPACDCICRGRNHGAGLQQAIDNNREALGLTPEDIEQFAKAHGYDPKTLEVYDTLKTPTAKIRRDRKRAQKEEAWRKIYEERRKVQEAGQ